MKRINITSTLTDHIRWFAAALAFGGMITLMTGCEGKSAAPSNAPKTQAKAPDASSPTSVIEKATADAKSAMASLPKVDLPAFDVPLPSQDELDLKAITDITDQNADAAFKDLEKDIDSDTGG